ncbi:DUF3641-containing protein [Fragilaria crotonensis]|nr:DUF3641-containing protein [Fragilaria crotonensis]
MRSVNLALFIHLTWNTLSNSDKLGLNQKISGLEKKKKWERMDLFGATLLDQTLDEIKSDDDFQETVKRMNKIGVAGIAINERINRHRALDSLKIPEFNTFFAQQMEKDGSLHRQEPQFLQITIGLYCHQACGHCHVEISPLRKEMMAAETVLNAGSGL